MAAKPSLLHLLSAVTQSRFPGFESLFPGFVTNRAAIPSSLPHTTPPLTQRQRSCTTWPKPAHLSTMTSIAGRNPLVPLDVRLLVLRTYTHHKHTHTSECSHLHYWPARAHTHTHTHTVKHKLETETEKTPMFLDCHYKGNDLSFNQNATHHRLCSQSFRPITRLDRLSILRSFVILSIIQHNNECFWTVR